MNLFPERDSALEKISSDFKNISKVSSNWFELASECGYMYLWDCYGLPAIQFPSDIVALQNIIYETKPDVVIEIGIARGGSIVHTASQLVLLDVAEGLDPRESHRSVIAVDVDIRPHNKAALTNHPFYFKMNLIEGSSIERGTIHLVRDMVSSTQRVLVILDSNHTHDHVMAELNAYADLVSPGSYCIVYDTVIDDLPAGSFPERPWDVGNNPKTAVHEWLKTHPEFEIDKDIDNKLLISVAPDGYLKRVS